MQTDDNNRTMIPQRADVVEAINAEARLDGVRNDECSNGSGRSRRADSDFDNWGFFRHSTFDLRISSTMHLLVRSSFPHTQSFEDGLVLFDVLVTNRQI